MASDLLLQLGFASESCRLETQEAEAKHEYVHAVAKRDHHEAIDEARSIISHLPTYADGTPFVPGHFDYPCWSTRKLPMSTKRDRVFPCKPFWNGERWTVNGHPDETFAFYKTEAEARAAADQQKGKG